MQTTTTATQGNYYVTFEGAYFVLRQVRFKAQLANGKEHPHDVCAYARTLNEMQRMVTNTLNTTADYSAAENA